MQITRPGDLAEGVGLRNANTLSKTAKSLQKILEKLATAQRINRASDDAAGLGISEQLRTQVRGFKMAEQNVTDAMSALNIADGAASEVSSMLQRQRELAIQASNATLNNEQRQGLDKEYQALTSEINRIANATQFNTQPVANGLGLSSGAAQIQAGAASGDTISLPTFDVSPGALGISGSSIGTPVAAMSAIQTAETALGTLNIQRSAIGAMTNRFEHMQTSLQVAQINTQAAESTIRDQDMAQGLTELTKQRMLLEGGTKTFARFQEITANHLFALLQQ